MCSFDIVVPDDYEPPRGPDYCMVDVRCFLCRFRYDENDLIIAIYGEHITPEFHFQQMEEIDLDNGIRIHMCGRSSCIVHRKDAYTVHTGCYSIARDSFLPSFAAAVAYDYRPSYEDERLRAKRIRDAASAKLRASILKHLSQELVDMIAEYLVVEVAAVHSQEIFSSVRFKKEFKYRLDLRRDIYVRYREIEGVSYVQWLSNTNMGGKGLRIYKARRREKIKGLWVAFDHLGVRRIDYKKHPVEISLGAGTLPYWKEIRPDTDEKIFVCIHDGLKLRTVKHEYGSDPIAWPRLHHEGYEAIHASGGERGYYGPRMTLLECQASNVRGYCAYASSTHGLVDAVIADIHDSPGYSRQVSRTYKSLSYGDWMYMPIDEGEHVEDIWVVNFDYGGGALMFVTNLGRASMLGRMVDFDNKARPKFLRIFSRPCGPASQLYLGDIEYHLHKQTIEAIGIDKNLKRIPSNDVHSFVPRIKPEWNPYPPALTPSASQWPPFPSLKYFNKCRLEDVSHITCCVNQDHTHRPIVGMMLHYRGGRRACVGQYRHDWVVQPPLVVNDAESMPLILTMYRDCDYGEYVEDSKGIYIMAASVGGASVQSADSGDLEGKYVWKTLRIPWLGWLEWWFSDSHHWNDRSFFHVAHVG